MAETTAGLDDRRAACLLIKTAAANLLAGLQLLPRIYTLVFVFLVVLPRSFDLHARGFQKTRWQPYRRIRMSSCTGT